MLKKETERAIEIKRVREEECGRTKWGYYAVDGEVLRVGFVYKVRRVATGLNVGKPFRRDRSKLTKLITLKRRVDCSRGGR